MFDESTNSTYFFNTSTQVRSIWIVRILDHFRSLDYNCAMRSLPTCVTHSELLGATAANPVDSSQILLCIPSVCYDSIVQKRHSNTSLKRAIFGSAAGTPSMYS